MDPVTHAANRFRAELEAFWSPPPGHGPQGPKVVRLIATGSDRREMVKALRIAEWQPENRYPFVIVEAPFSSETSFALAIAETLEGDYEKLRAGLAEDGVHIAALPPLSRPPAIASLRAQILRAAERVSMVLDGMLLALAPARIDDGPAYKAFVRILSPLSNGTTLRLCVLDHPEVRSDLPSTATFDVDQDALLSFLKEMGNAPSKGPAINAPRLAPEQKARLEKELGRRLVSQPTGRELRILLLDAGKAMSDGRFKSAARKFRAARMLCHLSGLVEEEAATSIAVGSAALANKDVKAALAAYRTAKQIAIAHGLTMLGAQAEFGIAGTHFFVGNYGEARVSYGAIACVAELPPALRIEAMRMEAECHLHEKRPTEASGRFREVLDEVERLDLDVRKTTSYEVAGQALVRLLKGIGQNNQAAKVQAQVASLGTRQVAIPAEESSA